MSATVIRFIVSVPVLSTQSAVAEPSVSTAGMRRVRTWCCEIRHAPRARKTVRTTGNSSGSIAIPRVRPARSPFRKSPRVSVKTVTTVAQSPRPMKAKSRTSRAVSRWSGRVLGLQHRERPADLPHLRRAADRADLGDALALARRAFPEKTKGVSSPPGRPHSSGSRAADFPTGTDSPVRSDSSTERLVALRTTASAGTRSPSLRRRTSPRTTSRPAILFFPPERTTSARGLARSRSASSARSVFRSWTNVMPRTTKTNPRRRSASLTSPRTR